MRAGPREMGPRLGSGGCEHWLDQLAFGTLGRLQYGYGGALPNEREANAASPAKVASGGVETGTCGFLD